MHTYGLMRIRYHIGYIYSLIHIHGLIHIRYRIFCICMISHVLTISHVLPIFRSSDLPIFRSSDILYDVAPYVSNVEYLYLYVLLWTCTTYMAFRLWNLSTVTGVTPTVSNYHNTPSQSCDLVTEDAFPRYLYHPHSKFSKLKILTLYSCSW